MAAPGTATDPVAQKRLTPGIWLVIILLALFWGGSFPANRLALAELPVLTIVALRTSGAAILLWIWVIWRRLPVPTRPRQLLDLFVLGCASNAIPFMLVVWGQTHVPSGLAGIINSSVAIVTVIVSALFFRDERLTANRLAGVMVGSAGVIIVMGAESLTSLNPASLGQLSIFLGGFSYALATVYTRVALRAIRPEVAAAAMFTSAAVVLAPLAIYWNGPPDFAFRTETWLALGFLACLSSAAAYMLLYTFIGRAGAGNLNLSTLLNGPVAVLFGALMFHESLPLQVYAGFAVITLGLLLIDGRLARRSRTQTAATKRGPER